MVPGSGVTPSPLKTDDTESKSFLRRAGQIVLIGHSSILYTTTLNLRSFGMFVLGAEVETRLLAADSLVPLSVLIGLSTVLVTLLINVIVSARSFSSLALRVARSSTFEERYYYQYNLFIGH